MRNVFKRFIAFLIDIIIVTWISATISSASFMNPKYNEYKEYAETYDAAIQNIGDKSLNEISTELTDISYDMERTGYVYTIYDIVIYYLYFAVFAYFTEGATVGKRIMNFKLSTQDEKKPKLTQYFIRTTIMYGIIPSTINLIGLLFNKTIFLKIYSISNILNLAIVIMMIVSIIGNKENIGINDRLAGTKVISIK